MTSSIRFGAAFFCEDVRHEASGKSIFIGTYTGEMTTNVNPASVYLHLVLIFRADDIATGRVELIVSAGDSKLADADYEVHSSGPGNVFSVFPLLAVEDLTADTVLSVKIRIDEGEWETGYVGTVRVGDEAGVPSD